ncbi:hypothetical protein HMN09_00354600 [Mycena chlorophos]|uniref:Vacuolar protein 8 n=1 Tax=Mycena chlorophos TaxID=658473 RepID=A0A8H6TJT2_MYCCL|nr:hypothetical protein HMN09_00354600 [Mycena chlorophos]
MSFFSRLSKGGGSGGNEAGEKRGGDEKKAPNSAPKAKASFFGAATKAVKTRWVTEQTRELLTAHQKIPLTDPTAAKFWEFFKDENSSDETRSLVALQFAHECKQSEAQANLVAGYLRAHAADFDTLYTSSLPKARAYMALIIGHLASYSSTAEVVLGTKPAERLARLMDDLDREVRDSALFALLRLAAASPNGAQMAANADVLRRAVGFLRSKVDNERLKSLHLMANIAKHEKTAPAVLSLRPTQTLVALTGDQNPAIQRVALVALVHLSLWPAGAQAILQTTFFERASVLLDLPEAISRGHTAQILGRMCIHRSLPAAANAVLALNPCERLVTLLSDPNEEVTRVTLYALGKISLLPAGRQPVASAGAVQFAVDALGSSTQGRVVSGIEILNSLARSEETLPLVLSANPFEGLMHLLDTELQRKNALVALHPLTEWHDGAHMAVQAGILQCLIQFLSPEAGIVPQIRHLSIQILSAIADKESLHPVLSEACPMVALVPLLSDTDPLVQRIAANIIARISATNLESVHAFIDASGVAAIPLLLDSADSDVRGQGCLLVAMLAKEETTYLTLLSVDIAPKLVAIVSNDAQSVIRFAIIALTTLALWPETQEAIADANLAARGDESPSITIRSTQQGTWYCAMNVDIAADPSVGITEAIRMPFPFREIGIWMPDEPRVVKSLELMRVVESLAGMPSEGAALMQRLVLFCLRLPLHVLEGRHLFMLPARYQTLARVLFLSCERANTDEVASRLTEDELLIIIRDVLVAYADGSGDVLDSEGAFTAAWLLVQIAHRTHRVTTSPNGGPNPISSYY